MNNIKEKMKSWPLWLAIASLITFCVKEFTGIDISESLDTFLNLLLPILITFGVVNNPNDRKGF